MIDSLAGRGAVVLGVLLLAVVLGLLLRSRNGRRRTVRSSIPELSRLIPTIVPDGEPVVVQISAAVCSPCRATARTWRRVLPEARHRELDIEQHPAVAEALGVWRTPASFVFDGEGALVSRLEGTPSLAQANAALAEAAAHAAPTTVDAPTTTIPTTATKAA